MATAPRAALLARIISLVVLFIAPASPAHGGAGGAGAGAARLPALQCRLRGEEMASAPGSDWRCQKRTCSLAGPLHARQHDCAGSCILPAALRGGGAPSARGKGSKGRTKPSQDSEEAEEKMRRQVQAAQSSSEDNASSDGASSVAADDAKARRGISYI